jgi:tRNA dimethylallyltransferase
MDRAALVERISERAEAIAASDAADEAARADANGASRTARAAIGFEELIAGDQEAYVRAQRAFARRQLTWMRRLEGVHAIDRTELDDAGVAKEIVALIEG